MKATRTRNRRYSLKPGATPYAAWPVTLASSLLVLMASGALAAPPNVVLPAGTVPVLKEAVRGVTKDDFVPKQTATGTLLTINQRERRAIANFEKFGIAAGSEVKFVQPDAASSFLARVIGNEASIIQGKLTANGQVFLLNRNGILFDRGSQVNVNTLVASTLNLKDEDFLKGFGANGQSATRFVPFTDDAGNALPSQSILIGVNGPAGAAAPTLDALREGSIILIAPEIENRGVITATDGQVILAAGQTAFLWQRDTERDGDSKASALRGLMVEISAGSDPLNVSSVVNNLGSISADRGNVTIAALAINQQGRISAGSSVVRNGSIWLTARSVADRGVDTSFSDSDSVRTAQYGKVWLAPGSVTETPLLVDEGRLSESDGYANFAATTVGTNGTTTTQSRDFRSWIHVVGNEIHNQGSIVSPGGSIDLIARENLLTITNPDGSTRQEMIRLPSGSGSRILLDQGSVVSAAGDWVDREMSDNFITIPRLTSNDLADAAIQRSGALKGASVTVDVRTGSPLLDVSKYANNRLRTVQDKATTGGAINIEAAEGEFITKAGSTVDVSGGGFRYAAGSYTTTKLLGADGKYYDIGTASPLRTYLGTAGAITRTYQKAGPMGWNITKSFATQTQTLPTFESAYVQGADAGTLSIVARTTVTQGELRGGVTMGRYQINATDAARVPHGAVLTVGRVNDESGDYTVSAISFGRSESLDSGFGLDAALPDSIKPGSAVLASDMFRPTAAGPEEYRYDGFGSLNLFATNSIVVPAGETVQVAPGGNVTARTETKNHPASSITLASATGDKAGGAIAAPAGTINLAASKVTVGSGASIDASGMVIGDERPAAGLGAAGGFTARGGDSIESYALNNLHALLDDYANSSGRPAGSVAAPRFAINAAPNAIGISAPDVDIQAGSTLAAMGGFRLGADNTLTAGNGGRISLGTVSALGGNLLGFALGTGGKLRLEAPVVRVRDALPASPVAGELVLTPAFFQRGGFTDYALTGQSVMTIADNTVIEPQARNVQVRVSNLAVRPGASDALTAFDGRLFTGVVAGSGAAGTVAADVAVREKPAGERAPTNVAFSLRPVELTPGQTNAENLVFGENAEIRTDPRASVSFSASAASPASLNVGAEIALSGRIFAPGGSISASYTGSTLGAGSPLFDPANPDADRQSGAIVLGRNAVLSTRGEFVRNTATTAFANATNADGSIGLRELVSGEVTSGGSVTLAATKGRVVTLAGSRIDVSGVSAVVDLPVDLGATRYQQTQIAGDAGSISVSSTEASRLDGDLRAQAAAGAAGGTFNLAFQRSVPGEGERGSSAHRLVVSGGESDALARTDASGASYVTSRISASKIAEAGFDSVRLGSDHAIELAGDVSLAPRLALTLDAPVLDVRDRTGGTRIASSARLSTNHLTLQNSFGDPLQSVSSSDIKALPTMPTANGAGTLAGSARLIDVIGGVTVNGLRTGRDAGGAPVQSFSLASATDVRLSGLPTSTDADGLKGALRTAGNIDIAAQQVYPTTLSTFTLASQSVVDGVASNSGTVTFRAAPGAPAPVLSAGGNLAVLADEIVQAGAVKAPMGGIVLKAPAITLKDGSTTSVSLDGQTVLMGETVNGRAWRYNLAPSGDTAISEATSAVLNSPGAKQITLEGDKVVKQAGATVDLSGGGEVQAFEFVPGPGGSKDVLRTTSSNKTWAIVPSMRLADGPADTHLATRAGTSLTSAGSPGNTRYNTIYIKGVDGIAEGYYPLLDAHYALLPGAFQITAVSDARIADRPLGTTTLQLDGTQVIAAYRGVAGSDTHESRTQAYAIRAGSRALADSELHLTDSSFFATQALAKDLAAPRIARDAGGLTVLATRDLALEGKLRTTPATGGRAAEVDISADLLSVVSQPGQRGAAYAAEIADLVARGVALSPDAHFVEVAASVFAGFDGSLLLGGTRDANGNLNTTAQQVLVSGDAATPMQAAELMLAAKDKVAVKAGSVIDATVPGVTTRDTLTTTGDGAFMRASSDGQLTLARSGVSGTGGVLDIASGATIVGKSVVLDSTGVTRANGTMQQGAGGKLSMSSGKVALGEVSGTAIDTLQLDNARLANLASLDEVALRSYSNIDLVGNARVGSAQLGKLVLDAREIIGSAARDANGNPVSTPAAARIEAQQVSLRNTGSAAPGASAPTGSGTLDIVAQRVELGAGDKSLRGFNGVNISAATELAQTGTGTLGIESAARIATPRVVGSAKASQKVVAESGDKSISYDIALQGADVASSGALAPTAATPGGRWSFGGKSVSVDTAILTPAGRIELAASGAAPGDNVTLGANAQLDASGYRKQFTDAAAYASAGTVTLTSVAGDVRMNTGAKILLDADAGGGDAGRLTVSAAAGTVSLDGAVSGNASAANKQGSASIDANTIAAAGDTLARLSAAGMQEELQARQRSGDLTLGATRTDTIKARHIAASADAGNIVLNGKLDASSATGGGRVELNAGKILTLAAGSSVDASGTSTGTAATDPYANGGKVELRGAQAVAFADGASVNISAGAKGDAGRVTFASTRSAAGDALPLTLNGTVVAKPGAGGAAGEVIARGDRVYEADNLNAFVVPDATNAAWSDLQAYAANAAGVRDRLGATLKVDRGAGAVVDPNALAMQSGIEIRSAAASPDLTLNSAWDLTTAGWNPVDANGNVLRAGVLAIRAEGDLAIAASLGLPDDTNLPTGKSWSIRLAGGSDLTAANPLALARLDSLVQNGRGDVLIRDDGGAIDTVGKVRTGTGDIEIAAGRDFKLGSNTGDPATGNRAVVYSAGVAAVSTTVDPLQRYTQGGGDIRINAQRDAVGAMDPAGRAGELVNDWLRRTTVAQATRVDGIGPGDYIRSKSAGWWVYRPAFKHGVGSFGGGDVAVSAGEDLRNLSVVVPTSGRANTESPSTTLTRLDSLLDAAGNPVLEVRGGGNLDVRAGEDVSGGDFLVGLGVGRVRAGGALGAETPVGAYLQGQGSDAASDGASLGFEAVGDAVLRAIANPTILALPRSTLEAGTTPNVGYGRNVAGFFTYSPTSEASLLSVTGNVSLGRSLVEQFQTANGALNGDWSSVAPPKLSLVAMGGGIEQRFGATDSISKPIDLYPSIRGTLRVLAQDQIVNLNVRATNVAIDTVPTWAHPGATSGTGTGFALGSGSPSQEPENFVFSADRKRLPMLANASGAPNFVIETISGDILSPTLNVSSSASLRAGRDLVSGSIAIQNLFADDVSIVATSRDIVQDPQRYRGEVENIQDTGRSALAILVAGPGTAIVQSGRNMDLGTSQGIVADGNTRNASLTTTASARVIAIAGVSGKVNPAAVDALMSATKTFGLLGDTTAAPMTTALQAQLAAARASGDAGSLDALVVALAAYASGSAGSENARKTAGAASDALAAARSAVAKGAPSAVVGSLLDGMLALAATNSADGAAVNATANAGAKGVAAAVFAANKVGPGNIDLFNTKIQTTGGSGIDLVAPGVDANGNAAGVINAGLPAGSGGNIGISTQTGGGIRAYLSGNLNVNQSKILTAQGGDIMLYSSVGSIDAGRGALTSRSSSPPRKVPIFKDGELIGYAYLPPVDVAGSGIRTVTSDPDGAGPRTAPPAGSIFLFAPSGTIDAGEAGIDSAGNVTIRAVQVLNANAISAAGSSSGVPVVESTPIGALTNNTNTAAGTKSVTDEQAKQSDNRQRGTEDALKPTILLVEVLGFGESDTDPRKRQP